MKTAELIMPKNHKTNMKWIMTSMALFTVALFATVPMEDKGYTPSISTQQTSIAADGHIRDSIAISNVEKIISGYELRKTND